MGDIKLNINEIQAKHLHFVLKHDLIGGLLPREMIDSIHQVKTKLEFKLDEVIGDES